MQKYTAHIVVMVLVLAVAIRIAIFYSHRPVYRGGETVTQAVRISSEPKVRGRNQQFSVRLKDSTPIWVTAEKFPSLHFGQEIALLGTVQVTRMSDGKSFLTMKYPEIVSVTRGSSSFSWVDRLRLRAIDILNHRLPHVHALLLAGIVLGAKQDMPDDVISSFQTSGVMHVIAASGMNVSMVAGALLLLLQGTVGRRKALWLSMVGVLFYVFLAGFEPPIVRAGFMAVVVFIGTLLGRQKVSLYTLLLVASCMVLFNPQLIVDIGFQLSVFATAGILVLQPLFLSLIRGKWKLLIQADITTTLAAQIATLPILLSNFGSINLLSVGINALVLWTVPILMTLGGLGVMAGLLYEPLSIPFLYSSIPFVWYFLTVVTLSSRYPIPLSFEVFPGSLTVGYYFLLTAFVVWWRQKQMSKRNTTGNGERVGN